MGDIWSICFEMIVCVEGLLERCVNETKRNCLTETQIGREKNNEILETLQNTLISKFQPLFGEFFLKNWQQLL